MTSHDLRGLDCVEGALNHVPSNSSLLFSGMVCEPGGYQGKNHQTKARAYCLLTADGHGQVLESAAIARRSRRASHQ
jgi:hypothetical protein